MKMIINDVCARYLVFNMNIKWVVRLCRKIYRTLLKMDHQIFIAYVSNLLRPHMHNQGTPRLGTTASELGGI